MLLSILPSTAQYAMHVALWLHAREHVPCTLPALPACPAPSNAAAHPTSSTRQASCTSMFTPSTPGPRRSWLSRLADSRLAGSAAAERYQTVLMVLMACCSPACRASYAAADSAALATPGRKDAAFYTGG